MRTRLISAYLLVPLPGLRMHLELTDALTVDSFLYPSGDLLLDGDLPSTIWSDNAKTFKAASKEIRRMACSPEVAKYLSSNRVT